MKLGTELSRAHGRIGIALGGSDRAVEALAILEQHRHPREDFIGEARRQVIGLDDVNTPTDRKNIAGVERRTGHLQRADLPAHQQRRQRKSQGVLGLVGVGRRVALQAHGLMEGFDLDTLDGLAAYLWMLSQLEGWATGDPLDPNVRIGALIEQAHMEKVLSHIEQAKAEGCKLVTGGVRLHAESGGYFVAPTIFEASSNAASVAQEEIFGPVLAVIAFDTEEQAIANDTCYGLAASLWTANINCAHRMAAAIRAGTVSVNCFSEGDICTPFGGYKQSGFGGRDKSIYAHDQYCELKTTWIQLS